jgi:hypothetical protein
MVHLPHNRQFTVSTVAAVVHTAVVHYKYWSRAFMVFFPLQLPRYDSITSLYVDLAIESIKSSMCDVPIRVIIMLNLFYRLQKPWPNVPHPMMVHLPRSVSELMTVSSNTISPYRFIHERIIGNQTIPTTPLADKHASAILEQFLTTDMMYPQMEDALLSYLGDQYSADDWKESRDALFSGDGDDKLALANLRAVKAKHIHPALSAPKDSSMSNRRSTSACIQSSRRRAKVSESI